MLYQQAEGLIPSDIKINREKLWNCFDPQKGCRLTACGGRKTAICAAFPAVAVSFDLFIGFGTPNLIFSPEKTCPAATADVKFEKTAREALRKLLKNLGVQVDSNIASCVIFI